jgi:1,4-dihydroxy-6-naphthoate synthase
MDNHEITVGHSPDPDDAFMFYALTRGKIDPEGLRFREVIEDIETLNHRAAAGKLDVTALSVHAYGYVADKYALLPCGGSFGDRCGPVVVARRPMEVGELADSRIGVPGTMTSAYLLLKLLLMNFRFEVICFDKIIDAVVRGEVDAGLLIHEGQITFQEQGLYKVVDLGEWWHADTGLPVPLGVNGVRKDLGNQLMQKLSRLLSASIRYGLQHRAEAVGHALQYARGMSVAHTDRFVGMYVNHWTEAMGDDGRQAVTRLLTRAYHAALLPQPVRVEIVESARWEGDQATI